jgi:hypothetical protein
MNPKYVFTLGQDTESVQFRINDDVNDIIVNSNSLSAQNIKMGDLAEVRMDGVSVFGILIGDKSKKENGNWWFQLLRVNPGANAEE